MHLFDFLLFFAVLWLLSFEEVEGRKVTQAPKKVTKSAKPDKSWARSMIDSAKNKYHHAKSSVKEKYHHAKDEVKEKYHHAKDVVKEKLHRDNSKYAPNSNYMDIRTTKFVPKFENQRTTKYIPNSNYMNLQTTKSVPNYAMNDGFLKTTKKSIFQRAKEKAKEGQYFQKAVGFVKKDLGIGVDGPKKPSKIVKFGKKAVEWVFKKKAKKIASNGDQSMNGQYVPSGNLMVSRVASKLHDKVQYIQDQVTNLQNEIQESWNTSEAGTKYKLFEEPKSWEDAQIHCEQLGSNLAFLDSESKNQFATSLLQYSNISHAWFGLCTDVETQGTSGSREFNNFSNSNGCGVVDQNGAWSISTCSLELPYLCQAIRLNVYVDIPLNEP